MFILGRKKGRKNKVSKKGLLSFGIQHRCKSTEASLEHVVSIFMVEEQAKQDQSCAYYLLHVDFLLGLFFKPEYRGNTFLRNVA
jgi:hypothetical protein